MGTLSNVSIVGGSGIKVEWLGRLKLADTPWCRDPRLLRKPPFSKFLEECVARKAEWIEMEPIDSVLGDKYPITVTKLIRLMGHGFKLRGRLRPSSVDLSAPDIYPQLRLFDEIVAIVPTFRKRLCKRLSGHRPLKLRTLARLVENVNVEIPLRSGVKLVRLHREVELAIERGARTIGLVEPEGGPRIGDPLNGIALRRCHYLGLPVYSVHGTSVSYWDEARVQGLGIVTLADGEVVVDSSKAMVPVLS